MYDFSNLFPLEYLNVDIVMPYMYFAPKRKKFWSLWINHSLRHQPGITTGNLPGLKNIALTDVE